MAGFIPKKYGTEIMLTALRVVSGGIFLPPKARYERVASNSVRQMQRVTSDAPSKAAASGQAPHTRRATDALIDIESRFANLTARQGEVYRAVARGLPNKLIAGELGITESTVKTHLSAVYAVLGVNNRTQAAFQASREEFRVGGEGRGARSVN